MPPQLWRCHMQPLPAGTTRWPCPWLRPNRVLVGSWSLPLCTCRCVKADNKANGVTYRLVLQSCGLLLTCWCIEWKIPASVCTSLWYAAPCSDANVCVCCSGADASCKRRPWRTRHTRGHCRSGAVTVACHGPGVWLVQHCQQQVCITPSPLTYCCLTAV